MAFLTIFDRHRSRNIVTSLLSGAGGGSSGDFVTDDDGNFVTDDDGNFVIAG